MFKTVFVKITHISRSARMTNNLSGNNAYFVLNQIQIKATLTQIMTVLHEVKKQLLILLLRTGFCKDSHF